MNDQDIKEAVEYFESCKERLDAKSKALFELGKAFLEIGNEILPEVDEHSGACLGGSSYCTCGNPKIHKIMQETKLRLLKNIPKKKVELKEIIEEDWQANIYYNGWNDCIDKLMKRIGGKGENITSM